MLPTMLRSQRFLPLFVTQFMGAFNDNVYKNALVILITYRLAEQNGSDARMLVTAAAAIFMLPYLLFSASAGQLADKYDRARIARIVKLWELCIVALAAVGFAIQSANFLLLVLFFLGTHSTFFGPVKYALLPQHLEQDELVLGIALINAGSFLAILLGTISGGLLVLMPGGEKLVTTLMLAVALVGYVASRSIPAAPGAMPALKLDWNMPRQTWRMVAMQRQNRMVMRCILGISWFWLLGSAYLSQFPTLAKEVLNADETVVTFFLTLFSLGIGAGSLLCSRLLRGQISWQTVPWGALGLSVFTIDLSFSTQAVVQAGGELVSLAGFLALPGAWRVVADLVLVPVSAGLYIVPLYALMQHHCAPAFRARAVATNNIVNALFMVLSGVFIMGMLAAQFTIPQVFLTLGVINVGVVWFAWRVPPSSQT